MFTKTLTIDTARPRNLVDITQQVSREISQSGIREGVCHLFVPHTTAGLTLNENCDPDVVTDMLDTLERLVPNRSDYRHAEGNSPAHVKTSLLGNQLTLLIAGGRPVLGTWQGVFLAEFDGPRTRKVLLQIP
ncbi:MAG: YjbQ family protein [Magnetococcales bacterium]|nr:YjbQ family protein [Magnetococcales bacterium]